MKKFIEMIALFLLLFIELYILGTILTDIWNLSILQTGLPEISKITSLGFLVMYGLLQVKGESKGKSFKEIVTELITRVVIYFLMYLGFIYIFMEFGRG